MWFTQYWGQMPTDCSKISKKKLARMENNQEFINAFNNYYTLALSQFAWENLPDTCDERMIERSMLLYGQAMIARYNGAFISPAAAQGVDLNMYGYPLRGWGWGLNGFNHQFSLFVPGADEGPSLHEAASGLSSYPEPEAVVGWDNPDRYPFISYIYVAAKRLADLLRSCDVAVQNLKAPYIITCEEQQVKSVQEALSQREDNVAAIIASKLSVSTDNIKIWPTQTQPEVLTTFWQQYRNIEAMLLEILGVNANADTDKRERLLVDEVNANNDRIQQNFIKRLYQRELFCERVNSTFGLNISVHAREEDYHDMFEPDDPERLDDDTRPGDSVAGESGDSE